jgi:hypothetical protein
MFIYIYTNIYILIYLYAYVFIGVTKKRTVRVTSNTGLFLSLFVTFLYQMNQYVVAPTSGEYSDRLGMYVYVYMFLCVYVHVYM